MKNILSIIALLLCLHLSAQTTVQVIKGQVIDEASKSPLPGVSISLINSNPLIGTITDVNGNFKLGGVALGRQTLQFTFVGYEPQTIPNIIVTAGKEVSINISMTEKVQSINEVTISYNRKKDKTVTNNDMVAVSGRSFNTDDTKKYAGALGDPSRMAANFAGVISGNDSRNDIVVRGNSPTGLLWQLDGLNIPNPNHFGSAGSTGGPVSMLNNNNIDKSDFLTGAFPAQYGNALGGVFDLRLRDGNNEKSEFLGQIGFNGFELGAEGPFSKDSKASYIINYRYSTLALFQKLGIQFGTGNATPIYQDLNFKVSVPMKHHDKFTLFGLGGISSIDLLAKDIDTTQPNFYGQLNQNVFPRYRTGIAGASYERNITPKTFAKLIIGASHAEDYFHTDSIDLSKADKPTYLEYKGSNAANKYSAVFSLSHKFNAKNTLILGAIADFTYYNFYNKSYRPGHPIITHIDKSGNGVLTQQYAQFKHRFTEKLSASVGLHAQQLSINNTGTMEPRAGLNYSIDGRSSINLGYGLLSQAQNYYTYNIETATNNGVAYTNKDLGFTKAQHLILGYDIHITEQVHFKLEGYYQWLYNVPVTVSPTSYSALNDGASFAPDNQDSLVNKGKGRNYGVELTLERYFSKGYYFLITGSLFNSLYTGSDGVERNTAFNTKYATNILAGKEFILGHSKQNILEIDVKGTATGGKYLTPIDPIQSALQHQEVDIKTEAYQNKQADYLRMDIKIAFRKEYKKYTMEWAIDLQNVTNHQNIFRQGYNPLNNRISVDYQQGFFPVPYFKVTF